MKTFDITSGKMVCSDPCYVLGTWSQGVIENVKNGTWVADVDYSSDNRVSRLLVYNPNSDVNRNSLKRGGGHTLDFRAGVDSGQFGFFDHAFYMNNDSVGGNWYGRCCGLVLSEESWGVLPHGAVSSSGYGDGSYEVRGMKNDKDEYVAFCIEYIDENQDEDEYEYYDEDEE